MPAVPVQQVEVARGAWSSLWPIFDPTRETCAFIVGERQGERVRIDGFWPTPNLWRDDGPSERGADEGYIIGKDNWNRARAKARREGVELLGHAHTHLTEGARPSFWDYRVVSAHMLGLVWHLHSGRVTLFSARPERFLGSYSLKQLPPLMATMAAGYCDEADDLDVLPDPRPLRLASDPPEVEALALAWLETPRHYDRKTLKALRELVARA
jgi:proteasome lid subunit RPN8/RPN11